MNKKEISKALIVIEAVLLIISISIIAFSMLGLLAPIYLMVALLGIVIFSIILTVVFILDIKRKKKPFKIVYMLPTLIYVIIMAVIYFI